MSETIPDPENERDFANEAEARRARIEAATESRNRAAEVAEDARLAGGLTPRAMPHEPLEAFARRGAAWGQSPAGLAYAEKRAREAQQRQAEWARENWPDMVRDSGIPAVFADLIAAGPLEPTEAIMQVSGGAPFGILVLAGKVGVGKSVAAAYWLLGDYAPGSSRAQAARPSHPPGLRPLSEYGQGRAAKPLWVSAARLARWERYDEKEMNRLLRASRLVIDDLYTEYSDAKGNFQVILDEVVNDRLGNRRPIVITTNVDVEGFKERYGERIADRIRQYGRFVVFAGESLRRKDQGRTA